MNTADTVNNMINPEYLSHILGYEVTPTSVRIKPATSVVVGHVDAHGNHGWARVLWPTSAAKAHKIDAPVIPLGDKLFQHGPALADPKLFKHIRKAGISPNSHVLRYNPQRRLVVKEGDHVTRITEKAESFSVDLYEEISQYVPVPPRLDSGRRPHRSELEFLGTGDLTNLQAQEKFSFAAGVMAWQLHTAPIDAVPEHNPADARTQLKSHIELLSIMAPEFVDRLHRINEKLQPLEGPTVTLHGDLSPDQYLYGNQLWLTDFDRIHLGPAVKDLGSYLATSTFGEAFLDGYKSVARDIPSDHEIRLATAHAMVLRIADPLRQAHQNWHQEIDTNLTHIEEVLA